MPNLAAVAGAEIALGSGLSSPMPTAGQARGVKAREDDRIQSWSTTGSPMVSHALNRVNDGDLIREAQRGSRTAFEELVRQYDQAVLRLALHLTGSEAEAQDIYQEAFLKAYLNGEVTRLVVVDHLATPPDPVTTALGWIPDKIKALFGHSS